MTGDGLRETLEEACAEEASSLGDLTVLAVANDPFRVDTPTGHRNGEWLATTAAGLGLGDRIIHLRGLHYMLVSGEVTKPDGSPYRNVDEDWTFLQAKAAKAARWLGYLPFEQIKDARNAEPVIRVRDRTSPWSYMNVGIDIEIPSVEDLEPTVNVVGFTAVQSYRFAIFGEKTSLEEVLGDVALSCDADLYLPSGEISDTLLHQMARAAVEDGRPLVVFCFSDCDPAGWQMPISIGRKLQAFQAIGYEFEFQVHRVGLTPDQVRLYGLPSTPLKETEKRADKWLAEMGVEQTEIDALSALRPELLRSIAMDAIGPFYDYTLSSRVHDAQQAWLEEAQELVDSSLDQEELDRIRTEAGERLAELEEQIDVLQQALQIETIGVDLPEIVVPEAELNGGRPDALVDSTWSWTEQTQRLIRSKAYGD